MKKIDTSGLSCPAPVLLVKDTLEQEQLINLQVVTDNEASRENVARFLGTKGFSVTTRTQGESFILTAARDENVASQDVTTHASPLENSGKIVVLIMTDIMGQGDTELGRKLMANYIKTLAEMRPDLWQLIFVNTGVRLTTTGSPVIPELKQYQESGITVLACGTCLDHLNLLGEKQVGETTNMLDIVTATQLADKVITIG